MFSDARSKRLLLVAHCVLNQNAKLDRCAFYPGAIREAAQTVLDSGVGVIQMPCPEMLCFGLDRQTDLNAQPSVEAEDTRIAIRLSEPAYRRMMQEMVEQLLFQILEYRKHGFEVLGVLGINGSPSCAVEQTWVADAPQEGSGVFIEILMATLEKNDIHLPMRGIRAAEPGHAVAAVRALVG